MASVEEPSRLLRLGGVSFLNAQPLLHGLLEGMGSEAIRLRLAEPSVLTRMLFEDELDGALAPVAPLALHGGLQIVPEVAIGCDGPVRSVILVADRPLQEVDEVLLDGASRTSVILSRLILRHLRDGLEPSYCARPAEDIVAEVGGKTGGLLIGDAALAARDRFAHVVDLGEAWKSMTGLPFVFAAWVVRPDVLTAEDCALLQRSAQVGLAARGAIAKAWARGRGGDPLAHERYLTEHVQYTLGPMAVAGLREFMERAASARLLPKCDVKFVDPSAPSNAPVRASRSPRERAFARAELTERLSLNEARFLYTTTDLRRLMRLAHERVLELPPIDGATAHVPLVRESGGQKRPVTRGELVKQVGVLSEMGVRRVVLDGPLREGLHLEWFENLFQSLAAVRGVEIHALCPDDVVVLAQREDLSLSEVVRRLRQAGLAAVVGSGAAVLTDRARKERYEGACDSRTFLDVLRLCHRYGMRTWAMMEFGLVDTGTDRLLHLLKLRDLQDETGALLGVVLAPDPELSSMEPEFFLRTVAIARLLVDNVAMVRVHHGLDPRLIEQALQSGADGVYGLNGGEPTGATYSGVRPVGSSERDG